MEWVRSSGRRSLAHTFEDLSILSMNPAFLFLLFALETLIHWYWQGCRTELVCEREAWEKSQKQQDEVLLGSSRQWEEEKRGSPTVVAPSERKGSQRVSCFPRC